MLQKIVIASLFLTCIVFSPYVTFDPFNPSKLLALTTSAGAALGLLLLAVKLPEIKKFKYLIGVTGLLTIALILSTINSEQAFTTTFFGISGRNTGLLAYVSLIVLLTSSALASDEKFLRKISLTSLLIGVFSQIYAWFQILGLDRAPWSESNWIKSFFANPNFLSAFLGITASTACAFIFSKDEPQKNKLAAFVYLIITVITLVKIGNTQGFIVFGIGFLFICYCFIKNYFRKAKFHLTFIFLSLLVVIWAILDMLQKTPGKSYLWKLSVSSRGDYWRAAWNMALERPILGWGMDAYRDNFEKFRDATQATRGEGQMIGEIAHNVFLDLLVGGGFLLLIAYLMLILLALISVIKMLKRQKSYNVGVSASVASLIGYLAQSTISANHLGLAIWGWVLLGSLTGFEINSRVENIQDSTLNQRSGPKIKKFVKSEFSKSATSVLIAGGLVGFCLSLPLFLVNTKQMAATNHKNPEEIFYSALSWPKDTIRMCLFAERLREGGFEADAITLAREAAKFSPNSVVPLKVLTTFPSIPQGEKDELWRKIKSMDPYYELVPKQGS